MRIVLLGPYYPFRGGISDTNQELFNSLIKKGHKVYIIDFKLLYPKLLFPGKNQYEENNSSRRHEKTRGGQNQNRRRRFLRGGANPVRGAGQVFGLYRKRKEQCR